MNNHIKNRKIIMDNYQNPSNYIEHIPDNYLEIKAKIDTCSDEFNIFIRFDKYIIKDILFSGYGCAISTSSLNIIIDILINKSVFEAIKIIDNYKNFILNKKANIDILDDLIVFKNINKHLNRINCGLIGPNHIRILIKKRFFN